MLGENVGRFNEKTKARPPYIVGRVAGAYQDKAGAPVAETSHAQQFQEREFRS